MQARQKNSSSSAKNRPINLKGSTILDLLKVANRFESDFGEKMELGRQGNPAETDSIWLKKNLCIDVADAAEEKPRVAYCVSRLIQCGTDYWRTLMTMPKGYRLSVLDEVGYLIAAEKCLQMQGRSKREALDTELFDDFFYAKEWLFEWTHVLLRASKKGSDFRGYLEHDSTGRRFFVADYLIGDELIAEGVRIPEGGKILLWDESLRIPRVTSEGFEPNHTSHFHFDPYQTEVAIMLRRGKYVDEFTACLDVVGVRSRNLSARFCAYRLFDGGLETVIDHFRRS